MSDTVCGTNLGPPEWWCTRMLGHDGPCAAVPAVPLGEGRELPDCRPSAHLCPVEQLRDTRWTGSWDNWVAPFHACPRCGLSLGWGRAANSTTTAIVARCCGIKFSALLDKGGGVARDYPVVAAVEGADSPATSVPRAPTDLDVDRVEDAVGMGHGAWDMVDPKEIIRAAWSIAGKDTKDAFRLDGLEKQLREGWMIYFHETDSGRIYVTMRLDVTPRSVRVPSLLVAHGPDLRAAIDSPLTNIGGDKP